MWWDCTSKQNSDVNVTKLVNMCYVMVHDSTMKSQAFLGTYGIIVNI